MTTSSTKDEPLTVTDLDQFEAIAFGSKGGFVAVEYGAMMQFIRFARQALSQSHGEVRAAALEEAAKIADVEYDKVRIGDGEFGGGRANASRIIAGQIRAISKQSGTP